MKKVLLTKEQDWFIKKYDNKLDLLKDIHNIDVDTVFDDVEYNDIISALFDGYDVDDSLTYEEIPNFFNFKSTINTNGLTYRGTKVGDKIYISWETPYNEVQGDAMDKESLMNYLNTKKFLII